MPNTPSQITNTPNTPKYQICISLRVGVPCSICPLRSDEGFSKKTDGAPSFPHQTCLMQIITGGPLPTSTPTLNFPFQTSEDLPHATVLQGTCSLFSSCSFIQRCAFHDGSTNRLDAVSVSFAVSCFAEDMFQEPDGCAIQ